MTLLPENVKNPRKTYFNPFTLFRFCGIKASATATDKEIRTPCTNPEKTETTARRQPKTQIKPYFFAKEKPKPNTFVFDLGFDWRRGWDSNPCEVALKRFSRPPRCDRFDTSPYDEEMCRAVFARLAKWFCFAAFGRQPEMRLRNLYGIMPAACGLPACGTAFDLPFQYSKRGAVCQDFRGHKNRKPRHAAAFGRKSIRSLGGNYRPPVFPSLIPTRRLPAACRSRRRGSCRRGALPPQCGGQCSRVRPRGNPHRGRRTAPS